MGGSEIAAVFADLSGFVGALLLAVPFFLGQEPRDSVLLALARHSPDAATFDQTVQRHVQHIATHWHWEAFAARLGTCLIAFAFLVRLVSATAGYFGQAAG